MYAVCVGLRFGQVTPTRFWVLDFGETKRNIEAPVCNEHCPLQLWLLFLRCHRWEPKLRLMQIRTSHKATQENCTLPNVQTSLVPRTFPYVVKER